MPCGNCLSLSLFGHIGYSSFSFLHFQFLILKVRVLHGPGVWGLSRWAMAGPGRPAPSRCPTGSRAARSSPSTFLGTGPGCPGIVTGQGGSGAWPCCCTHGEGADGPRAGMGAWAMWEAWGRAGHLWVPSGPWCWMSGFLSRVFQKCTYYFPLQQMVKCVFRHGLWCRIQFSLQDCIPKTSLSSLKKSVAEIKLSLQFVNKTSPLCSHCSW